MKTGAEGREEQWGKKEVSGPRGPFGPLGPQGSPGSLDLLGPLVLWALSLVLCSSRSSGSLSFGLSTHRPLGPSGSSSYRVMVGSLMCSPDHQRPPSVSTTENCHKVGAKLWAQSLPWVFWNLPCSS